MLQSPSSKVQAITEAHARAAVRSMYVFMLTTSETATGLMKELPQRMCMIFRQIPIAITSGLRLHQKNLHAAMMPPYFQEYVRSFRGTVCPPLICQTGYLCGAM